MKRTLAVTLSLIAAVAAIPVLADENPRPHNDYGVMSPEVVRQRLVIAGHTNIKLVKTKTGYTATTIKNGQPQTLEIDSARMTIKPRAVELERKVPLALPTK
jgi:hypothetical protein